MTGHTPGPWMAASGPSSIVGWPIVGPGGRAIASLTWWPREHYQPDVTDEAYSALTAEIGANARLIAASPDLLKAAKRALSTFRAQGVHRDGNNVVAALEDAIALATQSKGA